MSTPHLSVVIEWDNVRYYEAVRARTMLQRLLGQIHEIPDLAGSVEVEVLYDELEIDGSMVERMVATVAGEQDPPVRVTSTRGLKYYQLKNEGGRRARGDVLLFVDSDVLPEDGWLRALVGSFANGTVDVVEGNSYVEPTTFYAKAFALGWYFPRRSAGGPLVPTDSALVNNIAMRRHVFERFPFPGDTAMYIGQCVAWARGLREHGVVTYVNPSARVAHPPPRFVRSALINGHDVARRTQRPGESRLESLRLSYWALRRHLRAGVGRIVRDRRDVGLSAGAVPLAVAIVGAYWGLWALAELATRWSPRLMPGQQLR